VIHYSFSVVNQLMTLQAVAKALNLTLNEARAIANKVISGPRDLFSKHEVSQMQSALNQRSPSPSSTDQLSLDLFASGNEAFGELFQSALALEQTLPMDAAAMYRRVLANDPWHADAHVNLGRILHHAKRLREAQAHYVAALVSRPKDAMATYNLAVVLEDLGLVDEAISQYSLAIHLNEFNVDAYYNLSRLYEKKGEKMQALRHLKDYRRLILK
jgi:tetratricopeptide (TPR) repeat protein